MRQIVLLEDPHQSETRQLDGVLKDVNRTIETEGASSLLPRLELGIATLALVFALLRLGDVGKEALESVIEVSQGVLHDPLGDAVQPWQVGVFAGSQFLLQVNGRRNFFSSLIGFLLATQTVVVGKPGGS